jgi:hypothetical protein
MRPLIEIARFFRPSFAGQGTKLSAVTHKYFSSSAKCRDAADDSGSLEKPEVLESSQDISAVEAEANINQPATNVKGTRVPWSADELRKLTDAIRNGMSIKATTALFPTKTFDSVAKQRRIYKSALSRNAERQSGRWQPAELELLRKLSKDGASTHNMSAHFPARSLRSVLSAVEKYARKPATAYGCKHRWSQEDRLYLAESVLQGADAYKIAKALDRTLEAVRKQASNIGIRFIPKVKRLSTEQTEQIVQMRTDGASFATIAAVFGRKVSSVRNHWSRLRPITDRDLRPLGRGTYPPTQLALDDYQTIRSLRDQDVPWSSIGSRYLQYQLGSIKQDFWLFEKGKLSSTDMRKIQDLRQEGETWETIAAMDDYLACTGSGLRKAYNRMLRNA